MLPPLLHRAWCVAPSLNDASPVQDMVHLRRKNLVHGEDHHKYVQPGPVDELPKAAGSGPPTRGSQDRSASGAAPSKPACIHLC